MTTDINFYNFSFSGSGVLTAGTPARVVLTRDSITNLVVGYVNGVQAISFTDGSGNGTFTGLNGIIQFFEDDNVTGGRESSGGVATHISIYDGALSASDVAALGGLSSVPEPASFLLLGMGLAGIAIATKRRIGQR